MTLVALFGVVGPSESDEDSDDSEEALSEFVSLSMSRVNDPRWRSTQTEDDSSWGSGMDIFKGARRASGLEKISLLVECWEYGEDGFLEGGSASTAFVDMEAVGMFGRIQHRAPLVKAMALVS
jgi:hypothetical protein